MDQPQHAPYQSVPTETSPFNPTPSVPAPAGKSPKKFLIPLAVALVLVGGYFAAAYYADLWPFAPSPTLSASPSPTSEPGTSEQPPKVSAVGTGTYTNKEFGFSFVIPAPLVGLESRYSETVYVNVGTEKEISEIRNLEGAGYRDFLSISAFSGTPSAEGCADYRSTTPITIAGASGIKCTGLEEFTGTVDNETALFTFFSPTNPTIFFIIASDQYTGANIATIDQILATLKFTAGGWTTYTNLQNGFSFRYPSDWTASLDGNTVFIDNGIENTSNIEPDPRWLQMQVLLPPDSTKSVTAGYEHRYYGPIEGWELVSNEFGSDSLSVILRLSADSYFSVGVYGAFVQQRAAVDSLFSTFTLKK